MHVELAVEKNYEKQFSICTIVNNPEEYLMMQESFLSKGFKENTQYLVANNTGKNKFDAYSATRRFLQETIGRYIIIVHQDVRCIDDAERLTDTLDKLQVKDPLWAICGNAGANGYKNFIINMNDNGKVKTHPGLPLKVTSLDENLLIIKSDAQITCSADLKGFHFYGTDLCIIADFLGYTCYVINFMVNHLSSGNLKQMNDYAPAFINTYGRKFRERLIQTTCTKFYLADSSSKNRMYNKPYIFFWVKAAHRFTKLFKKNSFT
ncbi:MAG: hypothetical protein ABIP80_07675 [Ferruginibacter sp.]